MIQNKKDYWKAITIAFFLSVPFASSVISTWHIFDLFELGNPSWMSVVLACVIEMGSLASLLALGNMKKIKIIYVWFIFIILFALQIIGNLFYSYNYVTIKLESTKSWLFTFTEFMQTLGLVDDPKLPMVKLILSCIIGLTIPLISLCFLKSTVDYLKVDDEPVKEIQPIIESQQPVVEEVVEEITEEKEENVEEVLPETINEVKEEIVETPKKSSGIHIQVQPNINKA